MAKSAQRKGRHHKRQPKEFDEEVIQIRRVTRVVKGGRILRFRAVVVIGDRKKRVGIGVGKSHEVTGAIKKAIADAKKNLEHVVLDGNTIPHDVTIKHKSSKIRFIPAAPGTGIIAGGPIRKVLELAGVKDILSKSYGTTNKINNTRATLEALRKMRVTPMMEKRKTEKAPKQDNQKKETQKKEEKAKKSTQATASKKANAKKAEDKKESSK